MNDVLSRFLVVMEDEVDAYWCFTLFMDSIFNDFLEDGMIKKLCKYSINSSKSPGCLDKSFWVGACVFQYLLQGSTQKWTISTIWG